MGTTDRFSTDDVQRILGLTGKQLEYWERLRLVSPRKGAGDRSYDFRDLIALRTVKQLIENGVPANRLRRALAALNEKLAHAHAPLAELRILSDGKDVVVEHGATRVEPLSGQFVLNFETREIEERVQVITQRSADDWFAIALSHELADGRRAECISAYESALGIDPKKVDALLNCGALFYEDRNFKKAAEYFGRAAEAAPESALAHFNLGSVLEEVGDLEGARRHLRQAVRLAPEYADAHYNLALVCEKLSAGDEAREHWQAYVRLDPSGPWSVHARQRLLASEPRRAGSRRR